MGCIVQAINIIIYHYLYTLEVTSNWSVWMTTLNECVSVQFINMLSLSHLHLTQTHSYTYFPISTPMPIDPNSCPISTPMPHPYTYGPSTTLMPHSYPYAPSLHQYHLPLLPPCSPYT